LFAFNFMINLLPLLSNITIFLFSVQSTAFKNYTRRISPGGIGPILVASYDTHGFLFLTFSAFTFIVIIILCLRLAI
jgi:hypothetical protein